MSNTREQEKMTMQQWSESDQITGGGETGKHGGVAPRKGPRGALCRFKSCPPDQRKENE